MENYFQKVKEYLIELDCNITYANETSEVFVVSNEQSGIKNLVIGCAAPILILEQFIFEVKDCTEEIYKGLLQKNREIVHGAFVLDETGTKVIYRDTLQIENLDFNEIEASINALRLLLSEYSGQLLKFAKI